MKRRYINLLSWRFRLYLIVRTRLLQWLAVWSIVAVCAFVVWQVNSRRFAAASDALALMDSRCAPLKSMQDENQRMTGRLAELHSHQSLLTRLDDEQVPYRLMGLVSRGVQACSGSIRVQTLHLTRTQEQLPRSPGQSAAQRAARPPKPQYQEVTTLKLTGLAADNLDISRFVAALRDSGVFASVDLRSSVGARIDTVHAQSFVVECMLLGGPPAIAPEEAVTASRS